MTPHTLALTEGFALFMQLASQEGGRKHAAAMAQLQASTLRHMIDAVVSRRVDVVARQCHDILSMYAEQARHYMQEQGALHARMDTTDSLLRTELLSKSNDIDTQLAEIRADAKYLYERMGEFILALGGRGMDFLPASMGAVGLSPRMADD